MVYCTIGYNRVPRWCPNMKWGRRGLWWLDSKQDSEHNISRRVEKDEAGYFHQRQASRQLREFAQQARRRRRNGVVDLGGRCEVDRRRGQSLFIVMKLTRLSSAVSINTLCPYISIVSSSLLNITP
jgi:hypothetical protein